MAWYRRVLVTMGRREPEKPMFGPRTVEDAGDVWMELQYLMAPHLYGTVLLVLDPPMRAIANYRGRVEQWYPDPEFAEHYEDELRGVTPKYELEDDEYGTIGVYRVSDLPRRPFFSAVITPEGDWRDTPYDADGRYAEGVLEELHDCLGVVVQTVN